MILASVEIALQDLHRQGSSDRQRVNRGMPAMRGGAEPRVGSPRQVSQAGSHQQASQYPILVTGRCRRTPPYPDGVRRLRISRRTADAFQAYWRARPGSGRRSYELRPGLRSASGSGRREHPWPSHPPPRWIGVRSDLILPQVRVSSGQTNRSFGDFE